MSLLLCGAYLAPVRAEEEHPRPSSGFSISAGGSFMLVPIPAITESYRSYEQDAKNDSRFARMDSPPSLLWQAGGFADFMWDIKSPFFIVSGLDILLQLPGGMSFYRGDREEQLNIDYRLNSFVLKLGGGIYMLRSANWYLRGRLNLRFGLGILTFEQSAEGADFGSKRTNITGLSSFGYGVSAEMEIIYRVNPRNGILLGIRGGFLNFSQWSGKDSTGTPVSLFLSEGSGASASRLIFLKDGENPPGDEQEASLIVPEAGFYLGVWQAL